MTSREVFIKTIMGDKAERIPIIANLTPQIAQKFGEMYDLPYKPKDSFLADRISYTEILLKLGNDAVLIGAGRAKDKPTIQIGDGLVRDEWGIEYKKIGYYNEAIKRPLSRIETVEDLSSYNFPDANAEGRWDYAESMMEKYKNDYGMVGDLEACVFELAWNLVGLEKFIIDMAFEKEYIDILLDRVLDYSIACGKKMIDIGVDMVWTGDDMGTQNGMMISPDMWRKYFKPRMKRLFGELKTHGNDVKIAYHSCGSIEPIIGDLVEIGLDILNPIQPAAKDMDLALLKKQYGKEIVFFGGVDVQGVLPNGTKEDVEQEVVRCINAAGDGGKYIIAPAHNIQPDTPLENIFAFYEAVRQHGNY